MQDVSKTAMETKLFLYVTAVLASQEEERSEAKDSDGCRWQLLQYYIAVAAIFPSSFSHPPIWWPSSTQQLTICSTVRLAWFEYWQYVYLLGSPLDHDKAVHLSISAVD